MGEDAGEVAVVDCDVEAQIKLIVEAGQGLEVDETLQSLFQPLSIEAFLLLEGVSSNLSLHILHQAHLQI